MELGGAPEEERDGKKRVRSLEKSRTSTCAFADAVASAALDLFRSLEIEHEEARAALQSSVVQTCIAAVVLLDETTKELVVCSLGAGTKVVSEQDAVDEKGERVLDCHAEVLARRGFQRFLYSQLRLLRSGGPCILQEAEGRISLRGELSFHLYSSSAPCGNACVRRWAKGVGEKFQDNLGPFEWPKHVHESNRLQVHSPLQFTVLCKVAMDRDPDSADTVFNPDEVPPGTTLPDAPNASSRASCSDKIARWVALGLEGTLLNSLFGPSFEGIKLSTVVVGRKFSRLHLERAVCCRLGRFWQPSDLHPSVLCTAVKVQEGGKDASIKALFTDYGLAWALEPDRQQKAQVLVTSSGQPLDKDESPYYCRSSFWQLYHEALGLTSPTFSQEVYSETKKARLQPHLRDRRTLLFQCLKPWPCYRYRECS